MVHFIGIFSYILDYPKAMISDETLHSWSVLMIKNLVTSSISPKILVDMMKT